jgi:CBS domain containing-hemolysin-like protein
VVSLILILITTVISTVCTRWLIHHKNLSPIRASSLFTLGVLIASSGYTFELRPTLEAAVLGGTFVGMTDASKLSFRSLTFASILFSLVFYFIIPYNQGLGGALGFAAFVSCLITYFIKLNLMKFKLC